MVTADGRRGNRKQARSQEPGQASQTSKLDYILYDLPTNSGFERGSKLVVKTSLRSNTVKAGH